MIFGKIMKFQFDTSPKSQKSLTLLEKCKNLKEIFKIALW